MKWTVRILTIASIALLLTGCMGSGTTSSSTTTSSRPIFGLNLDQTSSQTLASNYTGVRLDVVVPVFDPGIPDNPDDYEKLGIWPEVRRTEAIRFSSLLQDELVRVNTFGEVRIAPDIAVASDLYVLGEIVKSNGEDLEVRLQVYAVTGKRWMKKTYKHRVKEHHWQDLRSSGKDPYQPLFRKAAKDIAALIKKKSSEKLAEVRAITDLQFANSFSNNIFIDHLEFDEKDNISLVSLPAENDPMLQRTRALRVADGAFMDRMQMNYDGFIQKTEDSYLAWQEHSLTASKERRKANDKAAMQGIMGALLLIGAASAADSSNSTLESVAVGAAAVGGVMMLQDSFASSAEGKYHRDTLNELGHSLNFEVAPQVIEIEESNVTLRGNVQEQYRQWRDMLGKIYQEEATPSVQL